MSSFLRQVSTKATRAAHVRAYHSPFVVLGQVPRKPQMSELAANPFAVYEKQYDFSHEPITPSLGNSTYVVSPDVSASHYKVPSGAYPMSTPYYAPTEAPDERGAQVSSTTFSFEHALTSEVVGEHEHHGA